MLRMGTSYLIFLMLCFVMLPQVFLRIPPCPDPLCPPGCYLSPSNKFQCRTCLCPWDIEIPDLCPICPPGCFKSSEVDEHGCKKCVCDWRKLPDLCPICPLGCFKSTEVDEHGCSKCVCDWRKLRDDCLNPICPAVWCPKGRKVDERGCVTCECEDWGEIM